MPVRRGARTLHGRRHFAPGRQFGSDVHTTVNCLSCAQHTQLEDLPPRDRIHVGSYWRVAHGWSALPGWLLVISKRHVLDFGNLTRDEATELGSILQEASAALSDVIGCPKTYVVSFGEEPGFEHLHLHVIPRMADFDKQQLGSAVFQFLKCPESQWVSTEARDRLSVALARHWIDDDMRDQRDGKEGKGRASPPERNQRSSWRTGPCSRRGVPGDRR